MNILLWVLQVVFGLYFIFVGIMHFIIPPGLLAAMSWRYELLPTLHRFSGFAEILGGFGLTLPGLTKIQTRLTPLAALGLLLVMIGAAAWHVQRGKFANIGRNLVNAIILALIAYGRWKLSPLTQRILDEPA